MGKKGRKHQRPVKAKCAAPFGTAVELSVDEEGLREIYQHGLGHFEWQTAESITKCIGKPSDGGPRLYFADWTAYFSKIPAFEYIRDTKMSNAAEKMMKGLVSKQKRGCTCVGSRCDREKGCCCCPTQMPAVAQNAADCVDLYECGDACSCGDRCKQRVLQRGLTGYIFTVFKDYKKGWTLRTNCPIKRGAFVCEYKGLMMTAKEASSCSEKKYQRDLHVVIRKEGKTDKVCRMVIDAKDMGNEARFISHDSEPNLFCLRVHFDIDGRPARHIGIYASRDIQPGEELTLDYQAKVLVPEVAPLEVAPLEVAHPEVIPPEVAPLEVIPPEVIPPEVIPPEVAPLEVIPPEVAPLEVIPPEVIPPEVAPLEVSHPEVISTSSQENVRPSEEVILAERILISPLDGDKKKKTKKRDLPIINMNGGANAKQARMQARFEREEMIEEERNLGREFHTPPFTPRRTRNNSVTSFSSQSIISTSSNNRTAVSSSFVQDEVTSKSTGKRRMEEEESTISLGRRGGRKREDSRARLDSGVSPRTPLASPTKECAPPLVPAVPPPPMTRSYAATIAIQPAKVSKSSSSISLPSAVPPSIPPSTPPSLPSSNSPSKEGENTLMPERWYTQSSIGWEIVSLGLYESAILRSHERDAPSSSLSTFDLMKYNPWEGQTFDLGEMSIFGRKLLGS